MDAMYNNPSRGGNYLPGTQSCTPIVEMITKNDYGHGIQEPNLPQEKNATRASLFTFRALLANISCWQTFVWCREISSQNFFSSIEQGPLANKITHVSADGCNQFSSSVNNPDIDKLLCSQHLKRGQWRKFYSMAELLAPGLFGTVDPSGRNWELASSIINRPCYISYTKGMKCLHFCHGKSEIGHITLPHRGSQVV